MKTRYIFAFLIALASFAAYAYSAEPSCTESVSAAEAKETLEISTDVPSHLKGATIVVRLADGRESAVPAERFKVVPRKQQFIVTKLETAKVVSCSVGEARKNRVSLLGGHGAQGGLNYSSDGSNATVESKTGPVGGAQYQRMLNDTISIGVQGQTNKTGSVLIGVDF